MNNSPIFKAPVYNNQLQYPINYPMRIITILLSLFISSTVLYAENNKSLSLAYLVREARIKSTHPPLLLLLHGYGSNEADLFSFAPQLPDKFLVISAQAPNKLATNSYAWYPLNFEAGQPAFKVADFEKSRKQLLNFIEELKKKYTIDTTQIYLCGFSQGAVMSYAIALTQPEIVKGIAVMSGRIPEELKPMVSKSSALKNVRLFISHGKNDPVINYATALAAVDFLHTLGLIPLFKSYEAVHEINAAMFNDLLEWLNQSDKK